MIRLTLLLGGHPIVMTKPITIFSFCLLAVVSCNHKQTVAPDQVSASPTPAVAASPTPSPNTHLSLNDVFAWRKDYADLLGQPKEAAIERYGHDFKVVDQVVMQWTASDRTGKRVVYLFLRSRGPNAKIGGVKVFARDGEEIEPLDVLKKSVLLTFDSGTYRDSSTNYLVCTTKDKRNSVQFDVSDAHVTFRAAMFKDTNR